MKVENAFEAMVRDAVRDAFVPVTARTLTIHQEFAREGMAELLEYVARRYGLSHEVILGKKRWGHIVRARHELMAELWWHKMSYSAIGRLMHRDHTTVMNGVWRHRRRMGVGL